MISVAVADDIVGDVVTVVAMAVVVVVVVGVAVAASSAYVTMLLNSSSIASAGQGTTRALLRLSSCPRLLATPMRSPA